MSYRSKRTDLVKLIEAIEEWIDSPSYERRRISTWLYTSGRLVEDCDTGDLQGVAKPFNAAYDLLEEVSLASCELLSILRAELALITCTSCDDEKEVGELFCSTCTRLDSWEGTTSV